MTSFFNEKGQNFKSFRGETVRNEDTALDVVIIDYFQTKGVFCSIMF
jgi:hypothetical protein